MTRRSRFIISAALSTAFLVGLGALWHGFEIPASQAQSPAPPPAAPTVVVANPIMREITEHREFAGRFEPSAAVEIRARVTGHIESIGFADGDLVQAGQLLFAIDPRPYRARLDEARASLASAAAQLELADRELRRAEQLAGNAVSRATLEQHQQQKKMADAARELAEATLNRAEIELGFTEVRAPFTGRISNRRLDIGALVTDGTMLTTVVALDPIYFVFDMSEHDLLTYEEAVRRGGLPTMYGRQIPVEAKAQRDNDWPYQGIIDFVDNRLEAGAGTIRTRARISNTNQLLTPGQFGRVRLPFTGSYTAMLVPETALLTDQNRRVLLVASADDTIRSVPVELGPHQPGGLRIVRGGISPDDRVVISGLLRARPGQKVTPQRGDAVPGASDTLATN
ncbi:RND family efflux transporter, MFP subunit [Xaviernesmea oryzae]|uniref:RND family efflux transporter, MFP subunit n=2 Tax=Rhizobium/Agrobacterium group TaxID=227290 RepID=A0A1X7FT72_9HYPH|nr:efflux RND transporter periplasmic adaptor subunit [Xaviernesmea oryzae]SMF58390.1 RND family efflux transporter, MFP subunit [Xaviernesmea oryzae]